MCVCWVQVIAMSLRFYIRDWWNRFDMVILLLSLPELVLDEGLSSISVLRALRIGRLFKLVRRRRQHLNTISCKLPVRSSVIIVAPMSHQ